MEVLMLQVCDPEDATELALPQNGSLNWRQEIQAGEPVATIVSAARRMKAELLVMTTHSPLRPMARMRGSRTDKVLRDLRVPLLSIPTL
jgi:nucleotide-binding universal stress UspA family protein